MYDSPQHQKGFLPVGKLNIKHLCFSLISFFFSAMPLIGMEPPEGDRPSKRAKRDFSSPEQGQQIFGVPTYDATFKYVMEDPEVRLSFLNTFIPDAAVVSKFLHKAFSVL